MNVKIEHDFISEKFGIINDENKSEKCINLSKEELLNLLVEYKQKLTRHKIQSIHFDGVDELLNSVDELKDVLKSQHELYRETLNKEGIPFKEKDMNGIKVTLVNFDDIRGKEYVLKINHPKLIEVKEKINLVTNY